MANQHAAPVHPTSWSPELTELTRVRLHHPPSLSPRVLCLKNSDGRFGIVAMQDLAARRWIITDREDGTGTVYGSIHLLISDGWVLD